MCVYCAVGTSMTVFVLYVKACVLWHHAYVSTLRLLSAVLPTIMHDALAPYVYGTTASLIVLTVVTDFIRSGISEYRVSLANVVSIDIFNM